MAAGAQGEDADQACAVQLAFGQVFYTIGINGIKW